MTVTRKIGKHLSKVYRKCSAACYPNVKSYFHSVAEVLSHLQAGGASIHAATRSPHRLHHMDHSGSEKFCSSSTAGMLNSLMSRTPVTSTPSGMPDNGNTYVSGDTTAAIANQYSSAFALPAAEISPRSQQQAAAASAWAQHHHYHSSYQQHFFGGHQTSTATPTSTSTVNSEGNKETTLQGNFIDP